MRYDKSELVEQLLRQWERLVTSALLHADWMHLLFNMLTLYFFAPTLERFLGTPRFLLIYLGAILGGSLLSLFMYRRQPYYSAIGASGGVPGWIFAIAYLAYSIYGMRRTLGNVGHAAHLGGALVGFVLAIAFWPATLSRNLLFIALMAVPLVVLGYYVYKEK